MRGRIFLHVWIEPLVQRCCWLLKPFMSTGNSAGVTTSERNTKLPARELRAVGQVEVFGERVVLPAAGGLDARFAARGRRCR